MSETSADLLDRAGRAAAAGRAEEAISLLQKAVVSDPSNPRVLNALGNRLLAQGASRDAVLLFQRAAEADPLAISIWLNLASACNASDDRDGEMAALNSALSIEPYAGVALLMKAKLQESLGDEDGAAATYAALLASAPVGAQLPSAMVAAIEHGKTVVAHFQQRLGERIEASVADTGITSARFDQSIALLRGRTRRFESRPTGFYYPYLPAVPFFDREQFQWFAELEEATADIREELIAVMARDQGIEPYVSISSEKPVNQWAQLNNNLEWSAFFLWRNGMAIEDHLAACPKTAALLAGLPLLDIESQGPTAMFSILKPGAIIPPHTGITNIRAVVHLPLVVPPDCGFRVGAETREWREGVAWGFDDTIEHEAWNRSDRARAILIVDCWNPYLTDDERHLLRRATPAMRKNLSDD